MKAESTVGYDEARAHVGHGGEAVIESRHKRKKQRQGFYGASVGTLASFISAAEKVIMSVWILKRGKSESATLAAAEFRAPSKRYTLRGS